MPTAPDAPPLWELSKRSPTDDALADDSRNLTWQELEERTNAVGHGVEAMGLRPGDHVTLVAGNRVEFIEVLIGVQRAGMVVTPLKTSWTPSEIEVVLRDAGTRLVITDVDAARRSAADCGLPVVDLDDFEAWIAPHDVAPLPVDRHGWRMSYTSGTTGRPKGVVHPWSGKSPVSDAFASSAAWAEGTNLPRDGAHLMASQLFHGAPLMFGLAALARGAPMRILPRWEPSTFLRRVGDNVASTSMVPTMFRHVLALPDDDRARFTAPALRTVLHGGEPCPPELKRRMIDWWGPIFTEYFGFSEGGVTFATTDEWLARPGTVGKPPAQREVLIADDNGEALPRGQAGTVYFRFTDGTRFQYHGDPDKTAKAYRSDGFFTAGDIGYLDEDGYLYISGRQAEVIVSAGVNVYPAEVEAVVDSVAGVADVAVAGGPDAERGEQVVAFIVPVAGTDAAAVVAAVEAACGAQLAGYKRPRRIVVRDELPRDPTGKLLRRHLRDELWEGEAGTGFAVSS